MRSTDVFPSKWLKAEEIPTGGLVVTIKRVVLEEVQSERGKVKKPVAHFEGQKPLILNKTNWGLVARMHGEESDEWAGKSVTLIFRITG